MLRGVNDPNPHGLKKPIEDMSIQELKNTVKSQKAQITRSWNDLQKLCEIMTADKITSPAMVEQITGIFAYIQFKRAFVTELYQTIANADDQQEGWVQQRLTAWDKDEAPRINTYFKYLSMIPKEAMPAAASGIKVETPRPDTGDKSKDPPKPNTTLKPDKLSLEVNPVEFRHWMKRFRAFYRTSQLHKIGVADQREYLNECLDAPLAGIMETKCPETLEILSNDRTVLTCLKVLENIWNERHPLNIRRHKYFGLQFTGNLADIQTFLSTLEEMGSVAEIGAMTESNINAYKALSSIADTDLRKACFKEQDLTMERFRILAMERVREDESLKVFKKDAKVQQVPAEDASVNAVMKAKAICYRCGFKGHFANECKNKPKNQNRESGNAYVRQAEAQDSSDDSESGSTDEVEVNAVKKGQKNSSNGHSTKHRNKQKDKPFSKRKAKASAVETMPAKGGNGAATTDVTTNVMALLSNPLNNVK